MCAFIVVINLLLCVILIQAQTGYICVPVADLIAEPFGFSSKQRVKAAYESLSVSPEQGKESCLRVHQAIFNESVTIVASKNDQVQIILKNCVSKAMMGFFDETVKVWTFKDWVITDKELNQLGIDCSIFPGSYNEKTRCDESIISLLAPWYDDVTKIIYSAGTRFCLSPQQSNPDHYALILFDVHDKKLALSTVPKSYVVPSGFFTYEERRWLFVKLLYSWCNEGESVPFVWGGTSFSNFVSDDVVLKRSFTNNSATVSWDCSSCVTRPLSGLDASGLILRAAQICGIPYYCCNSRSIANSLSTVSFCALQEGDILWAPGYVGVIASLQNNEIIEAQGYARGYGSVHCISLKKRFAEIETWKDFVYCCENRIPLKSLDSQGRCVAYVPLFRVYRLPI